MKTLKFDFWLIFDRWNSKVRLTKRAPGMETTERAMHCTVNLPLSLFTQPQLKATVSVPEQHVDMPTIDIEAAETALAKVLGATVQFEVIPPEADEPEQDQ